MAPEILERNSKDRSYDETTDVYAFGIALWEMLTCLDVRLHHHPHRRDDGDCCDCSPRAAHRHSATKATGPCLSCERRFVATLDLPFPLRRRFGACATSLHAGRRSPRLTRYWLLAQHPHLAGILLGRDTEHQADVRRAAGRAGAHHHRVQGDRGPCQDL